jgi:RNA polymerase sigma-70 factor (ECF subfamily)
MAGASDSRTDALLLEAVRDLRDERAWAAFRERYEGLIRGCCLKQGLDREAADELTQAVLVKLVEAMPGFEYDRRGRFRSWLRTLVRNAVVDSRRRAARRPGDRGSGDTAHQAALADSPDPGTVDPEAVADALHAQLESDRRIRAACDQVKERVGDRIWQAFWLKTVEGRRGAEIAQRLGMTVGAVYQAGSRVRSLLERELGVFSGAGGGQ